MHIVPAVAPWPVLFLVRCKRRPEDASFAILLLVVVPFLMTGQYGSKFARRCRLRVRDLLRPNWADAEIGADHAMGHRGAERRVQPQCC